MNIFSFSWQLGPLVLPAPAWAVEKPQSPWTHQEEEGEFWSGERTGGRSAMQGPTRFVFLVAVSRSWFQWRTLTLGFPSRSPADAEQVALPAPLSVAALDTSPRREGGLSETAVPFSPWLVLGMSEDDFVSVWDTRVVSDSSLPF